MSCRKDRHGILLSHTDWKVALKLLSMNDSRPEWEALKSIVFIGNHLPRQCGIATFTTHLLESIALNAPDKACWAVALNDRPEGYSYPSQVRFEINQNQLNEYCLLKPFLRLAHKRTFASYHDRSASIRVVAHSPIESDSSLKILLFSDKIGQQVCAN